MIENLQRMRCGGCGCGVFYIYTQDSTKAVHVECRNCKSVSVIKPFIQSGLEIAWGDDNNEGLLTVMSGDEQDKKLDAKIEKEE